MHRHLEGLFLGMIIREIYVLRSQGCLTRNIVRIHALPATWHGATMEDHLQAIIVGIAEDILIELHRLLLVATEEIHLDTYHANLLHPRHLLLAGDGIVHNLTRSLRSIILETIRIVPEHQAYLLALGILTQLFDALSAYLLVPPAIHQDGFITLSSSHIHHLHLVVIVNGIVLPDEPAPGIAGWLVSLTCLIQWLHYIVRDGGLYDRSQRRTHSDGTPGSFSRQWDTGIFGTDAIVLPLLREGDGIALARLVIRKTATWISARHTGFADQYPTVVAHLEETWEGIAHTELRLHVHRSIRSIFLLIRWLGALPTGHRSNLRTEEGSGLLREIESAHLIIYNHRLRIILLRTAHLILVGDVVVAYMKMESHGILLAVEETDGSIHHILLDITLLDAGHLVGKRLHFPTLQNAHGEIL